MTKYFKVRCSTIDGTMWFDGHGLVSTKAQAKVFPESIAGMVIAHAKAANAGRELDEKVGRLAMVEVPAHNRDHIVKYNGAGWRKEKRFFRRQGMDHPVETAYNEGQAAAMYSSMPRRLQANPYRPGRRHDEWQRGYDTAPTMDEAYGRSR
jgi:hypothetical protein